MGDPLTEGGHKMKIELTRRQILALFLAASSTIDDPVAMESTFLEPSGIINLETALEKVEDMLYKNKR